MTRVLVTGASGLLGRELLPSLLEAGYETRAMSRRRRVGDARSGVEWISADLSTGRGLAAAVVGVDVVVHAATSPIRRTRRVDLLGTGALLRQSEQASVSHLIFPSIIGVDSVPYSYYRQKLSAERAVMESDVAYSIQRAAKFHPFMNGLLATANRLPIMLLPTDFQDQPVDAREVALRLVHQITVGPGGMRPEFAGPEILTFGEMAEQWLRQRDAQKRVLRLPLPGRIAKRFRDGATTNPRADRGEMTWARWLAAFDPTEPLSVSAP